MEWSKLKTMILLMLVGVNVFLLALVGLRVGQGAYYDDETRQTTIQVLERGGVSFLPQQLPEDITFAPLTLTRDRGSQEEAARLLLGGPVTQTGESEVRPSYTGPNGRAEFSMNGSFTVELTAGSWPLPPGQSISQASASCLEQLGMQTAEAALTTQGDITRFSCCQSWEGAPVFSCQVVLTWQGDSLIRLEGSRLAGSSAAAPQSLLSTPTVLMRFLAGLNQAGYVCSQITGMTPGYQTSGSGRTVQLAPVWRIATDTGDYYVDAVTGAVAPET